MVKKMAVAEFKAHLADALREVEAGDRVVIERRGKAVAVLVPVDVAAAPSKSWLEEIEGVMEGVSDFEQIMSDVVRSRASAKPRAVELE